ncbi:steroidogenic acute regulatory protein, mitochondrial-like [Uloborus diversus]|uniref:steroidogenic acute regulatory protein, mitochondrial-like n=1 Tax=Uloborus diversus TaxID=327109 RepID=UPI00240A4C25|nr:steroidogenic acute regulatory protein, mitochondrial-like [Uloborus diversus]
MLLHKLFESLSFFIAEDSQHHWVTQIFKQKEPPRKKECFRELSNQIVEESLQIMKDEGWVEESRECDDVIYSRKIPKYGKVFKYEGIVNINAGKLKFKLFDEVEKSPEWNCCLTDAKVVQPIDNQTDVAHIVSKGYPFVSSRDFVNLRTWRKKGNDYVHSCISISHPKVPEHPSYVRGQHRLCTYVISPLPQDPNRSKVTWLMQVNLNGWLPQYIIDQTISIGMLDHVKAIKTFLAD